MSKPVMATVVEIVAFELGIEPDQVTLEANFAEDLGADSLDAINLILSYQEEFDIEIPDEDAERLTTVREVVNYITQQLA